MQVGGTGRGNKGGEYRERGRRKRYRVGRDLRREK